MRPMMMRRDGGDGDSQGVSARALSVWRHSVVSSKSNVSFYIISRGEHERTRARTHFNSFCGRSVPRARDSAFVH